MLPPLPRPVPSGGDVIPSLGDATPMHGETLPSFPRLLPSGEEAVPPESKGESAAEAGPSYAGEAMKIEDEEALYHLYLREKLEAAEDDVREGRILSHEDVIAETARWFAE